MASKKIIHLQMSELYSIVRGKAGKSVEVGLNWGINRVDGSVMGFLIDSGINASDQRFCIEGIKEHIAVFGQAPKTFGFDRGGYSKAKCAVSEKLSEVIRRERAQVEELKGNVKSKKYGFNKTNEKSTMAMEMSGQRSCLGFNLSKAIRKMNLQEV